MSPVCVVKIGFLAVGRSGSDLRAISRVPFDFEWAPPPGAGEDLFALDGSSHNNRPGSDIGPWWTLRRADRKLAAAACIFLGNQ
jgi:hypothetical protein